MRKNLDISREAVAIISAEAIKERTFFKQKAEKILEDYAKSVKPKKKGKKVEESDNN